MKKATTMIAIMLMTVVLIVSCGESKTNNNKESDINDDINEQTDADKDNKKDYDYDFDSYDEDISENDIESDHENDVDTVNLDDGEEADENDILGDDADNFSCVEGEINSVICSKDSSKVQKQICDENGVWQDDGDCFDPLTNVLCTSQTKCYNNFREILCPTVGNDFYGQDAQYAKFGYCIPKSFTISGTPPEEIIIDNNTGLQWQGSLRKNDTYYLYNWDESINICNNLNYGGYDDWRLPRVDELETIIDYGKYNPAIDQKYFYDVAIGVIDDFWTSSLYAGDSGTVWHIDLRNGDHQYSNYYYISKSVLCVRGDSLPKHTFVEELVKGEAVVSDAISNLQWQKTFLNYHGCTGGNQKGEQCYWQEALNYCENLYYAGSFNWRLPNINELKTIIDRDKFSPASDFPAISSKHFWSSSYKYGGETSSYYAWYADMLNGKIQYESKEMHKYVGCVTENINESENIPENKFYMNFNGNINLNINNYMTIKGGKGFSNFNINGADYSYGELDVIIITPMFPLAFYDENNIKIFWLENAPGLESETKKFFGISVPSDTLKGEHSFELSQAKAYFGDMDVEIQSGELNIKCIRAVADFGVVRVTSKTETTLNLTAYGDLILAKDAEFELLYQVCEE